MLQEYYFQQLCYLCNKVSAKHRNVMEVIIIALGALHTHSHSPWGGWGLWAANDHFSLLIFPYIHYIKLSFCLDHLYLGWSSFCLSRFDVNLIAVIAFFLVLQPCKVDPCSGWHVFTLIVLFLSVRFSVCSRKSQSPDVFVSVLGFLDMTWVDGNLHRHEHKMCNCLNALCTFTQKAMMEENCSTWDFFVCLCGFFRFFQHYVGRLLCGD